MAAVYVSNLIINIGSDFSQSFTLEGTDSNSPFDLTNFTAESKMRKWSGSAAFTSFSVTIIQPASLGRIVLNLSSAVTSSLKPGRYIYDVVITDNNSNVATKNRVIEGMVIVRDGATY
jgi:hypothetical protein